MVTVFHYTTRNAYAAMRTGAVYRPGLLPIRRFVSPWEAKHLPIEAYNGAIQALLEPEPQSWTENPEFSHMWKRLMYDIIVKANEYTDNGTVLLLSFDVTPGDDAYVVEWAHRERHLRKENPTEEMSENSCRDYWESRVPILDYKGGYSVPEVVIWNPVEYERLGVEQEISTAQLQQRIAEKDW